MMLIMLAKMMMIMMMTAKSIWCNRIQSDDLLFKLLHLITTSIGEHFNLSRDQNS